MNTLVPKAESPKKGLAGKLFNGVIIIFVLLCAAMLLSAYLSERGGSLLGIRSYIVLTGSMSPVFEAGSYIIVKEKSVEDIKVGDILTYEAGEAVLTHRVVEVIKEGSDYSFITQGDANNTPDKNPVTHDEILGTAVFWVNGLGLALMTLRQPKVMVGVFILLCIIVLAPELYGLVRGKVKRGDGIEN